MDGIFFLVAPNGDATLEQKPGGEARDSGTVDADAASTLAEDCTDVMVALARDRGIGPAEMVMASVLMAACIGGGLSKDGHEADTISEMADRLHEMAKTLAKSAG